MKKLVIFLILFIVSIPAFTQDESLFTENFSLIKDPKANNLGLYSFNISFPASYFFFTENKRQSRQHQAFQIIRSHQFSERTPLSRTTTVEDGRQNWGDRYNLIYGQQEYISSEKKSEYLAFGYLERFAERKKKSRKTQGPIALVVGVVCLSSGALLLFSTDVDFGAAFSGVILIGMGVGSVVYGTLALIPSGAEREFGNVQKISDPAQRERASHEALSSLAARGKKWRTLESVGLAAVSVYYLVRHAEPDYSVAWLGGLAIYNLLRKTRAEKTFQNYLKEREQRNKLEFLIGIRPYGGVKIGFVYSF